MGLWLGVYFFAQVNCPQRSPAPLPLCPPWQQHHLIAALLTSLCAWLQESVWTSVKCVTSDLTAPIVLMKSTVVCICLFVSQLESNYFNSKINKIHYSYLGKIAVKLSYNYLGKLMIINGLISKYLLLNIIIILC